ncbi:MAG TPA: alpha/beta hydrolase [Clostridiales bacterium]|nr:alpha/beta hydrolase [Clostridiales bacterium]
MNIEKDYYSDENIKIHYAEIENNYTPLLLIHGQCMCWSDYERVLEALGKRYHVFAVDCIGHGKSEHNKELYTCKIIGDLLCGFIEKQIGEPCFVSGHSSGGILAAYIAGQLPDLVKGVLLEDPPFFNVEPQEMQNTFVYKDGFSVFHSFLTQTQETEFMPYYLANSYIFSIFGGKFQKNLAEEARAYLKEHPGKELRLKRVKPDSLHGYKYIYDFDFLFAESFYTGSWFDSVNQEKILKSVKCPAIYLKAKTKYGPKKVLWAANTKEASDKVLGLIDHCQRIVIKSGHDIHYEKPDKFVEAMEMLQEIAAKTDAD